jgi:hypothetical protein
MRMVAVVAQGIKNLRQRQVRHALGDGFCRYAQSPRLPAPANKAALPCSPTQESGNISLSVNDCNNLD